MKPITLSPRHFAYIWHGTPHRDFITAGLTTCGLQLRTQIVRAKQHSTLACGDYYRKPESCWYAVREGKTCHVGGDRTQTTVPSTNLFGYRPRGRSWGDNTEKPVDRVRRSIVNTSPPDDPYRGPCRSLFGVKLTGPPVTLSSPAQLMSSCGAGSSPAAAGDVKPPANLSTSAPEKPDYDQLGAAHG